MPELSQCIAGLRKKTDFPLNKAEKNLGTMYPILHPCNIFTDEHNETSWFGFPDLSRVIALYEEINYTNERYLSSGQESILRHQMGLIHNGTGKVQFVSTIILTLIRHLHFILL